MANVIKHKRSTTPGAAPSAGQLAQGELAVNVADGTLFLKNTTSQIVGFPHLPLTAATNSVLSWNGTNWVAVDVMALIDILDGGTASAVGTTVVDGGNANS